MLPVSDLERARRFYDEMLGVEFEEYDLPGITSIDGIVQSGPNVWTAWFRDPDGNLLGLTQIG